MIRSFAPGVCAARIAALVPVGIAALGGSFVAARTSHAAPGRADLEIVECILPGQVRQLGNRTYVTQRRPTRTTAADCRIKGGEYVAYDRADLRTALNVWMEAAEQGDIEAQVNVGELFERGLGSEPNYEAAALWYRKAIDNPQAAEDEKARARFNLGTLFERGLGVELNRLKALDLYRQSLGAPADSLMFTSAANAELERQREELDRQIRDKDEQVRALEKQVEALRQNLERQASQDRQASAELDALQRIVAQLRKDRDVARQSLDALPTRTPATSAAPASFDATPPSRDSPQGGRFGRYYALIIANQDYLAIEDLETPRNDAQRAAALLRDRYGFNVSVLNDADDVAMLRALNELNEVLEADDNLLIYYAGHGMRLRTAASEAGYWLPVNAEPPPKDTFWVPNEQVTGHIGRLAAKRVLVVADSCYSGLLSADPSFLLIGKSGQVSEEYVRFKLPKRARLLISSGGDQPVLDQGGQGSSVFAGVFLSVLEQNRSVMTAAGLFGEVQARVRAIARRSGFDQEPQFKSIKGAGHEFGEFFFVPRP